MRRIALPEACGPCSDLIGNRLRACNFAQGNAMGLRLFFAGLLVFVAQTAFAEDTMDLVIGDATLRAPVPAGYVRGSEEAPTLFASSAAGLPPVNRLVEMLVARVDLKRILMGQPTSQPYLQVQTIRDAEPLDFTVAEWSAFQPMLAEQFGGMDLDRYTRNAQAGMGERMTQATGVEIEVDYGEIGKPTIYAMRPTAMHYTLRLPITAQVNGQTKTLDIECAGAVLLAGSKVVLVNAYTQAAAGQPPFAASRAMTESFVERLQALNPAPAAVSGTAGSEVP
jgi:hypothetical protein